MNFQQRLAASVAFEDAVVERLNKTGWPAFHFGQTLFSQECRERLKRSTDESGHPAMIRWIPDVITFCDLPSRSVTALIDAKVCGGGTTNYAIEQDAVKTAEIYTNYLYTPVFFVFDDWKILTPQQIHQQGRNGPPPRPGYGSGTPYFLVGKIYGVPFEEIFHPVFTYLVQN